MKKFTPRVDVKRRLVLIRIYCGIENNNSYCYIIQRINKKNKIDKRFKYLYCFGTDDYSTIKEFKSSITGDKVRIFKSSLKTVFGLKDKTDVISIWNKTLK